MQENLTQLSAGAGDLGIGAIEQGDAKEVSESYPESAEGSTVPSPKLSFAKSRGLQSSPSSRVTPQSQESKPIVQRTPAFLNISSDSLLARAEKVADMLNPKSVTGENIAPPFFIPSALKEERLSEEPSRAQNAESGEIKNDGVSLQKRLEKISISGLAASDHKRRMFVYASSCLVLSGAALYPIAVIFHWSTVSRIACWFLLLTPICIILALKEISKSLAKKNPQLAQKLCGWLTFGNPNALCHLASLYIDTGDHAQGEKHLSKASKAVPAKNLTDYISTHAYLAAARGRIGSISQSEKLMQDVLDLAYNLKESRPTQSSSIALAVALNCHAELEAQKQKYHEALAASLQALEELTALKIAPPELLIASLAGAGGYENELGSYVEASIYLEKAKALADVIPNIRASQGAQISANLGFAYAHLGDQKLSDEAFTRALQLAQSPSGLRELPTVHELMAKIYSEREQIAEADQSYVEAIAASQKQLPKTSYELVRLQSEYVIFLRKTGRPTEAATLELQAMQAKYSLDQTNFTDHAKKKANLPQVAKELVKAKSRFPVFCLLASAWYGFSVLLAGIRVASFASWALFIAFAAITAIKLRAKYGRRSTEEVHSGLVAVLSHVPYARYIVPELSSLPRKTVSVFVGCALALMGIVKISLIAPNTVPAAGLTPYEYSRLASAQVKKESFTKARDAYTHLGSFGGGWKDMAENSLQTALPRDPQPETVVATNSEALGLEKIDRLKAQTLWQSLITQYPNFEFPYIHLAESYMAGKDKSRLKEAEALVTKSLAINPQNSQALHAMWQIKRDQDDKVMASSYLDKISKWEVADFYTVVKVMAPRYLPAYNKLAVTYVDLKEHRKAIDASTKAIELQPTNSVAYLNRARALAEMGNWQGALQDSNEAIKADPKSAAAYNMRASAETETGQLDRAVTDCNTAILLDPKLGLAYNNLGWASVYLGEYKAAIDQFNKATVIDPKLAKPYNGKGIAYSRLGQDQLAIDECTKAIGLEPGYAKAYVNRGLAYSDLGKLDDALKDYDKAIELDKDCFAAYCLRAKLYEKQGKSELAQRDRENLKGHDSWTGRKLYLAA
jgi:tetratricopeptide (TPR) repeat protein